MVCFFAIVQEVHLQSCKKAPCLRANLQKISCYKKVILWLCPCSCDCKTRLEFLEEKKAEVDYIYALNSFAHLCRALQPVPQRIQMNWSLSKGLVNTRDTQFPVNLGIRWDTRHGWQRTRCLQMWNRWLNKANTKCWTISNTLANINSVEKGSMMDGEKPWDHITYGRPRSWPAQCVLRPNLHHDERSRMQDMLRGRIHTYRCNYYIACYIALKLLKPMNSNL